MHFSEGDSFFCYWDKERLKQETIVIRLRVHPYDGTHLRLFPRNDLGHVYHGDLTCQMFLAEKISRRLVYTPQLAETDTMHAPSRLTVARLVVLDVGKGGGGRGVAL